ncbi:AAA family ATPase [Candidatus Woesearchaeota archaeon]|nr:AAA family ATPase [Candidatus Woesearchaeota archaeon]
MGIFKDMLSSGETLFRNHIALDYDYIPKMVPYRDGEQRQIAMCIKPLFAQRNGRNCIITGPPGVGKTVACRHVLKEIEDETDEIEPLYINCWQKNTTYKVLVELCDLLGYKFTHNKKSDELFKVVAQMLNKKSTVLVFDEIDKAEDHDFLYMLLEEIYRKSIVLITNYREWIVSLDQRIKSRLTPEMIAFAPYSRKETRGILDERRKAAFVPGVFSDEAFGMVADLAFAHRDIRAGLYLMKEAGNAAEDRSSRTVGAEDVEAAKGKLGDFSVKRPDDLEEETRFILNIVKEHTGKRIGDLYKAYQDAGGTSVYKTFQRKIARLAENRFIAVKKVLGGADGTTTIVDYNASRPKTLDEY